MLFACVEAVMYLNPADGDVIAGYGLGLGDADAHCVAAGVVLDEVVCGDDVHGHGCAAVTGGRGACL